MTLTDAEVRAIDAAAEVLRRVAQEERQARCELHVRVDGRVEVVLCYSMHKARADLEPGGPDPTPGEALRRLVGL